jgi:hypothetical protein
LALGHCLTTLVVLIGGCQTLVPAAKTPPQDPLAAELKSAPEACLKQAYIRCSREASQRALDIGEAALCSMVCEALFSRCFGGDFHAFLAWSRQHPDDAPVEPWDPDACTAFRAEPKP